MHKQKKHWREKHIVDVGEKTKQEVTVTAGCNENNWGRSADQLIIGRYPVAGGHQALRKGGSYGPIRCQ